MKTPIDTPDTTAKVEAAADLEDALIESHRSSTRKICELHQRFRETIKKTRKGPTQ